MLIFSMTIFCLNFACGEDAGQKKNCAGMVMEMGTRPKMTGWGRG